MSAAPLYRNVDIKTYDFAIGVFIVLKERKFILPYQLLGFHLVMQKLKQPLCLFLEIKSRILNAAQK